MSTEFWLNNLESAKWIFVVFYVVSTIGVTIGVHWEGESQPEATKRLGLDAIAPATSHAGAIFGQVKFAVLFSSRDKTYNLKKGVTFEHPV
jgi:hypothetical protein